MNIEQRTKASTEQINQFIRSYYPQWRLAKLLMNIKMYESRHTLLNDIAQQTLKHTDESPSALIAQEFKMGLELDMLADCILYIEDLFALLRAGENIGYFIKRVVTYSAGEVEKYIKRGYSLDELKTLFLIPDLETNSDQKLNTIYNEGIKILLDNILFIKNFYEDYSFFYIQYKHGLSCAMRPYGNEFSPEQVQADINKPNDPYLVVYDNLEAKKIYKQKGRFQDMLFFPTLSPNISANIQELQKEDNLLRYCISGSETTIERFKLCAEKVKMCIIVFLNNLNSLVNSKGEVAVMSVPEPNGQYVSITLPSEYVKVSDLKAAKKIV